MLNLKLNIINITTSNTGGAGNAVVRINKVLNEFSNSKIIALKGSEKINSILIPNYDLYFFRIKMFRYLRHFINQKIQKKFKKKYNYYNYNEQKNYLNSTKLIRYFPFKPDVIIVHYTSHFLNFRTIYELQKITQSRIIFNMLDTAFLTGGCHYSWDCRGFQENCFNCPAIVTKNSLIANENFSQKLFYLNKIKCSINVSSSWALNQVRTSSLFKSIKLSLIYYPINENKYKPIKNISTKSESIIFFGTQDLNDPRKGVKYFTKSLKILESKVTNKQIKKIRIRIAGKKNSALLSSSKFKFDFLGLLDTKSLIEEYSKANIFVCSSIEDNGPMMINEALMCGTPVVCFDTGISKDLIDDKNGYISKNKDCNDMALGLYKLLYDCDNEKMKLNSRTNALNLYGIEKITKQWSKLIKNDSF